MRISDWSSDVCSSDLRPFQRRFHRLQCVSSQTYAQPIQLRCRIRKSAFYRLFPHGLRSKEISASPNVDPTYHPPGLWTYFLWNWKHENGYVPAGYWLAAHTSLKVATAESYPCHR